MNEREQMLSNILKCSRQDLYAQPLQLTSTQQDHLNSMLRRRNNGEPLQYILGDCEFMGLNLLCDERALIPRPETEILVDETLKFLNQPLPSFQGHILDLGTGTGNIPIALAYFLPNAKITTIDISAATQTLAKDNAERINVADRIQFICHDMREMSSIRPSIKADLIISNPPYIPSQNISQLPIDVRHEPHLALDGGVDGLDFLKSIINSCEQHLNPDGILALEFGDGQHDALGALIASLQWVKEFQFISDYTQTKRILLVRRNNS